MKELTLIYGPPIPASKDWRLIDLTDKYVFKQRLNCRVDGATRTPAEEWALHPEWRARDLPIHLKMCTLYPVPAGLAILARFPTTTRWLDPCAGWGDRLRCAMLTPRIKRYVGVDTNLSLQPAYQAMIRDLAPAKLR